MLLILPRLEILLDHILAILEFVVPDLFFHRLLSFPVQVLGEREVVSVLIFHNVTKYSSTSYLPTAFETDLPIP